MRLHALAPGDSWDMARHGVIIPSTAQLAEAPFLYGTSHMAAQTHAHTTAFARWCEARRIPTGIAVPARTRDLATLAYDLAHTPATHAKACAVTLLTAFALMETENPPCPPALPM